MSDNRVEGAGHKKIAGAVKEGFGKLTGNTELEAKGAIEKGAGSVQNAAGKVQDHAAGEPRAFVDHDRVEGAGKKMGGSIKEGVGKLTGDSKLQAEGKADQTAGGIQNAIGGMKDAVRDVFKK